LVRFTEQPIVQLQNIYTMANHRRGHRDAQRFSWQDRHNYSSAPYYSEGQRNNERYGDDTFGRPYGQDYPYTERNYNQDYGYPYGTGSRAQSNYRGGTYEGGYSNPDYRHADDYRQSGGYDFRHNPDNYDNDYRHRSTDRQGYRQHEFGNFGRESREYRNPGDGANEGNTSRWPESDQARFWERGRDEQRTGGQFRGKGPKGYVRSDERIKEDISDRLSDHDDIDASEIEVTVTKGEVILSGTVKDRYEKRTAEECAEKVSGVINVENRIRLQQQNNFEDNGDRSSMTASARPAFTSERARSRNQAMNES
jgi:hypothetical protein